MFSFTSLLQAADYAADSQDLWCTKEYTCTSEISIAIQMYFVKPGGFNVSIQAVPQGFASLILKGMTRTLLYEEKNKISLGSKDRQATET